MLAPPAALERRITSQGLGRHRMQLILLSKGRGQLGHANLASGRLWLTIAIVAVAICTGAFYAGINAARVFGISTQGQAETWRAELAQQQSIVDSTRRTLQQNLDALALRLGQMNAHVVRLDALGTRLTQ